MLANHIKTLFWGVLVPIAILCKGGLLAYMVTVIVLALIYLDWLNRKDMTTKILVIQAVIVVLFVLVSSGVLVLGGMLAFFS